MRLCGWHKKEGLGFFAFDHRIHMASSPVKYCANIWINANQFNRFIFLEGNRTRKSEIWTLVNQVASNIPDWSYVCSHFCMCKTCVNEHHWDSQRPISVWGTKLWAGTSEPTNSLIKQTKQANSKDNAHKHVLKDKKPKFRLSHHFSWQSNESLFVFPVQNPWISTCG